MQAQNPEVSTDKAITAAGMRLVSVDQLKKIHRDLDACQKVIWLAGCRPHVPSGFDPSYVYDAQERLKEIELLLPDQPVSNWTHSKPTTPGAYYVHVWLNEDGHRPALVEVELNNHGQLVRNVHQCNNNDDLREWAYVDDLSERLKWLGPLQLLGGY